MNDVAVERERDAKAEPGKLAGPASPAPGLAHGSGVFRAELPDGLGRFARCYRGAGAAVSHRHNTPLDSLMVSAGPARAVTDADPRRGPRRP